MNGRITLALVDPDNPFQQLLSADAEAAAREAGLELHTIFTGESLTEHLAALRRAFADPTHEPDALLVMAVRDQGLTHVVQEAAAAGVHWFFLNAVEDDFDPIRHRHPAIAITTVCPDEVETGRVQGRQLRALIGSGRRALYVQGNPRSLVSRLRTEGMRQGTGRRVGCSWGRRMGRRLGPPGEIHEGRGYAGHEPPPIGIVAWQAKNIKQKCAQGTPHREPASSPARVPRIPVLALAGLYDIGRRNRRPRADCSQPSCCTTSRSRPLSRGELLRRGKPHLPAGSPGPPLRLCHSTACRPPSRPHRDRGTFEQELDYRGPAGRLEAVLMHPGAAPVAAAVAPE